MITADTGTVPVSSTRTAAHPGSRRHLVGVELGQRELEHQGPERLLPELHGNPVDQPRVPRIHGDNARRRSQQDADVPHQQVHQRQRPSRRALQPGAARHHRRPGLVVPYDQTAQAAFRIKGTITSVTAKNNNDLGGANPTNPKVTFSRANGDYRIYSIAFDKTQLGTNLVTVNYTDAAGRTRSSVLQFSVTDKVANALNAHADFMVKNQQWTTADGITTDDIRYGTYDDWMMNAADGSLPSSTKAPEGKRNEYAGYYGLGDDWGLPHGEFLAAKNALDPVKTQVQSLDLYLEKAVWEHLMGNTADTTKPSYLVYDFWEQGKPGAANTTPSYRGYAYPHIYNTFFSMYQIAKQNPGLISYSHPSKWYLTQAYGVFKELYDGPVSYNWNTGLMGELTTPALIDALRTEGMTQQANDIEAKMAVKYKNFSSEKYPYGSEYSYDNTGEEAVYTLAKLNVNADKANALRMMRDNRGEDARSAGTDASLVLVRRPHHHHR